MGPFDLQGLTWILEAISNHMPSKERDEITYPLPNFNSFTTDKQFRPILYDACNYLTTPGHKLS